MSPPNIAVYELTLGNDKIAELAQGVLNTLPRNKG